jgi:glycosyltransferase involved in cell wall biosynthesis
MRRSIVESWSEVAVGTVMASGEKPFPVTATVCAYNAERFLERAVRSLCEQTHRELEILIVDDASTDGTPAVAAARARADCRVRVITLSANGGLAHARQIGIESACSEWVLFLDADDVALPEMIAKQVAVARRDPDIIAVSTYAFYVGDDAGTRIGEQRIGVRSKHEFFEKYRDAKLIFMSNPNLCSRRHVLAAGGYRQLEMAEEGSVRFQDLAEDLDLWCRLSDFGSEGKYMLTVQEPLFLYRKTSGSMSSTNVFRMQEKMRWIKDCLSRRRRGLPERTLSEYRRSIPWLAKLTHLRIDYAALAFKRMAFSYSKQEYGRAIVLMGAAGLLSPRLVVQKVRTQKRIRAG